MPIYEFECTECSEMFERLQKLSDPDPSICPKCGAARVKKRLTAPAFRLAGSGWYETDFKKDGDRKRNLAVNDDAPRADAKADTPESKPKAGEAKDAKAKPETKDSKAPATPSKPEGTASA